MRALLAVLGVALLAGFATAAPSAGVAFNDLQQSLSADKSRQDWHAYLKDALRLRRFVNGAPLSVLEVARAQLQLGRAPAALAEARAFLAMGQANDLLASPLFKPIAASFGPAIEANNAALLKSRRALELSGNQVSEDIDYDAASRRFFVTSILGGHITAIDAAGGEQPFAESPHHWPMLALKIDGRRRRLWATEAALDGYKNVAAEDWGRSAVLEYDLDHGTLLSRREGPAHSNFGDMALAPNGDPLISDGDGGGVYRLHAQRLERIDHGEFVSPQTIAVCDRRVAFVPDYVRGVALFDLLTGRARWLATQKRYAIAGIDGLYCRHGELTAIQNGTSPPRVIVFSLDASRQRIVGERLIERSPSGDFTHGVYVGESFYYLAQAGWNSLDEHGQAKSAAAPPTARIMVF
jgi:hypothetical protein